MNRPPRRVFDPGLQPERTSLAWRRTALSLVAGSLAGARLLAPQLGPPALALGAAGAALGAWVWVAAGRRGRRVSRELLRSGSLQAGPHAGLLAATALGCVLLGAAGAWVVLDAGLRGILTSR